MKLSLYSKIERFKMFIKYFIEKYSPICCLCSGRIDWRMFFPKFSGLTRDEFTIHHKDHNRKNERIENKAICHRECHRRHHREEQIWKEINSCKYSYFIYERLGTRIFKQKYKV